jgi:hypothetical protein
MDTYDNFLDQHSFVKIKELVFGSSFPWFYFPTMAYEDSKDGSWFGHLLMINNRKSNHIQYFENLFNKIKVKELLNAKVACQIFPSVSDYHVDRFSEKMNHKTAIFYLNTNNGYTEFKTGEKIFSIENRLLIFDCKKIHRGINQKNTERRIFLNINYYD